GVRIGRGLGARDADVHDVVHTRVRLEQLAERLLVREAGVIRADDDPPSHGHSASSGSSDAAAAATASAMSANEVAPGSGCPMLRSASGLARPRRGVIGAVASAAARAAAAASVRA